MTFDDGIVAVYKTENVAEKGKKPDIMLKKKSRYYFCFETVGISRYYTALNAGQKVDAVISIPGWEDVTGEDVCILEDGRQYKVLMVQNSTDENGLKIDRLTLERKNETYGIAEDF